MDDFASRITVALCLTVLKCKLREQLQEVSDDIGDPANLFENFTRSDAKFYAS